MIVLENYINFIGGFCDDKDFGVKIVYEEFE